MMTKTEAQRVATELGLNYDGIQEGIGHQFTDRVTGTTFYGNTPPEVKANLVEKRKLFNQFRRSKASQRAGGNRDEEASQ